LAQPSLSETCTLSHRAGLSRHTRTPRFTCAGATDVVPSQRTPLPGVRCKRWLGTGPGTGRRFGPPLDRPTTSPGYQDCSQEATPAPATPTARWCRGRLALAAGAAPAHRGPSRMPQAGSPCLPPPWARPHRALTPGRCAHPPPRPGARSAPAALAPRGHVGAGAWVAAPHGAAGQAGSPPRRRPLLGVAEGIPRWRDAARAGGVPSRVG
jgi:hypothetical protein